MKDDRIYLSHIRDAIHDIQAIGMTVGETAIGGGELVVITRRKIQ